MATVPAQRLRYEDYLALEASSDVKHEYFRGEAWAMAGGTPEHGRLQANLIREIGLALGKRPCVVLSSDVRIRIDASDPDLSVVCGKRQVSTIDPLAIVNPLTTVG